MSAIATPTPVRFANAAGDQHDGAPPVLTPEHLAQRAEAKQRRRKIDRAVAVATVSAWSLAVFAVLSLPFALFSLKAAFVGVGLAACAAFEFKGKRGLSQLDPGAPARLAWNQAALGVVITVYCCWSAHNAWFGGSAYAKAIATNPEVGPILEPFEDLVRQVTVAAYAAVLVISLIVQALTIGYYRSRKKLVAAYRQQTPAWILELDTPRPSEA